MRSPNETAGDVMKFRAKLSEGEENAWVLDSYLSVKWLFFAHVERFSNECLKTKT